MAPTNFILENFIKDFIMEQEDSLSIKYNTLEILLQEISMEILSLFNQIKMIRRQSLKNPINLS